MYFIVPAMLFAMSCAKTEQSLETGSEVLNSNNPNSPCVDIDGNVYKTIKIGNQVWMAENLRVTRYLNGQPVKLLTSANDWSGLSGQAEKGAMAFYNNDQANQRPYGLLYTWYAASDTRKLAPYGWHIPTEAEWIELGNALGGYLEAGGKLKSAGTINAGNGLWIAPNTGGTNSSGFNAVPAGERAADGSFDGLSARTRFWTANSFEGDGTNSFSLDVNLFSNQNTLYNSSGDNITSYNALAGLSVRCVKDK